MVSIYKRGGRGSYRIAYFDHSGKRHDVSSRTTDKRAAERIASKLEADVALRREGVIDADQARLADENRKPLALHVEEYLRHCERAERSKKTVGDRTRHLRWFQAATGVARYADITADTFERARAELRSRGLSARSANARLISLRAFLNWSVRSGRVASNSLRIVSKLDEIADRRYLRRALTEDELRRIFLVAEERGRTLWYSLAFWAGIRRGELSRLCWGDVNLDAMTLTIRRGKAKRVDVLPLHAELAEDLRRARPRDARHDERILSKEVTNRTRVRDFERAGIPLVDSNGFHADLHSTRMTLHTMLALRGVPMQVAQRLLRHADYRTTQRHYFHLDATQAGDALRLLPTLRSSAAKGSKSEQYLQHERQQSEHGSVREDAARCEGEKNGPGDRDRRKPLEPSPLCKAVPPGASSNVVRPPRFERGTFGFGGRRSIQLSYGRE